MCSGLQLNFRDVQTPHLITKPIAWYKQTEEFQWHFKGISESEAP